MSRPEDRVQYFLRRLQGQEGAPPSTSPAQRRLIQLLMEREFPLMAEREEQDPLARGAEEVGGLLPPMTREEGEERVGERRILEGLGAGALASGVYRPLEGVMGLLGGIPGPTQDFFQGASDWYRRLRVGLIRQSEESAMEAGVTADEIGAAHTLGEFVGYTAPVVSSIKLASVGLRSAASGVNIGRWALSGDLVTDATAGLIFGGVFEPAENHRERIWHMTRESALFGVTRLAFTSLAAFRSYRQRRRIQSGEFAEISEVFSTLERQGIMSPQTADNHRRLTGLLNEEAYISGSPAAQRILNRGAHESAIVQAIMDRGGGATSSGIVRGVTGNAEDVRTIIGNVQRDYPHLKFDTIKRGDTYDLVFGQRGLNNSQKAQLKREGRFEGQQVQHAYTGAEYEYVGRSSREGFVKLRRPVDGKTVTVKEENLTDLPTFSEPELRSPRLDELYRDFRSYYYDASERLANATGGATESDVIQMIREGTIDLSPRRRRAFDVGGAIVYPEELSSLRMPTSLDDAAGTVSEAGMETLSKMATPEEVAMLINQEGLSGGSKMLDAPVYATFDDIFEVWARDRGITEAADLTAAKTSFTTRLRRELWESVPEGERALYDKLMQEQLDLIDQGRAPFRALAEMKGFHMEALPDDSVVLREINTGSRFYFPDSIQAERFLKGVDRITEELPSLIPEMRGGIGLYTGGLPDPGSAWRFERLTSLEPTEIPKGRLRNLMNTLQDIEERTGNSVPIWSKGFLQVDRGHTLMRAEYAPEAKLIEKTWKGVSDTEKNQIVQIWMMGEEAGWGTAETAKIMERAGIPARGARAFIETRAILDRWYGMTGMDASRYVQTYYGRIRPYIETNKRMDIDAALQGLEPRPSEHRFWAEYTRTGNLSQVEMDPEVVMHKYIRSLLWKKHVETPWNQLAQLTGTKGNKPLRFSDLPEDTRRQALQAMKEINPEATVQSPVVPDPVRRILLEYLNSVRGTPNASIQALRDFFTDATSRLGVKVDGRVADELVHTLMAAQYGSLIGMRPWHVTRNLTQPLWMMYPRLGSRHTSSGLEKAMTMGGFREVYEEGVLRSAEAALPFADLIFEKIASLPMDATHPMGLPIKAALQSLVRTGRITRSMSERFLVPYTSGDALTRSWTYWWQKSHTDEFLQMFERGEISWDDFLDRGLPYFSSTVKNKFRELHRVHGREQALRFVGKQASDQTNFMYGAGVQPAWMQTWYGKLLGTFGTWPIWAVENFYIQSRNATAPQIAKYWARMGILGGIFSNIMLQTGYNLWSWVAPTSVLYSGGPYLDTIERTRRVISGPLDQKAGALRSLARSIPRMTLPGHSAYMDLERLMDESQDPAFRALGVFLGKPFDDQHWATDIVYNTDLPAGSPGSEVQRMQREDRRLPRPAAMETELPISMDVIEAIGGLDTRPGSIQLDFDISVPRTPRQIPLKGNF